MDAVDFRHILDCMTDTVIAVDGSHRIIFANTAVARLLGWTPSELVGQSPIILVPPQFQAQHREGFKRYATTKQAKIMGRDLRFSALRRDGREVEIDMRLNAVPSSRGDELIVATMRARKAPGMLERQLRNELASRVSQLKALLDHLPIGVAYFDRNAACRAANGPAVRFLGRSRSVLVGSNADELFEAYPELHKALMNCLRDRTAHLQRGVPCPDSSGALFLDWRFEPMPSPVPTGSAIGALVLIADVTIGTLAEDQLKRAAEAAEQTSKRKSQFLSAVSHDLRTPVHALSLQAEWLSRLLASEDQPSQELVTIATDLRRAAGNLVELVNDLLELTLFDSGVPDYRPSNFILGEWLGSLLAPLKLTAKSKGLSFTWRVDVPNRVIRADRIKLGRVLVNLAGNAVKFTETGGVEVAAGANAEGRLELSVRDTGPGIPANQLERIFDEFAQLRNPERDRTKGTGLGLAICRRLVHGAGGVLKVESNVGVGSCFTATYPADHLARINEVTIAAKPAQPRPRRPRKGSILLVEDDPFSRKSLARLIEREGYEVHSFDNGPDALAFLKQKVPGLVLLDLMLPGMDGAEVLREIRKHHSSDVLPVVILSGDVLSGRTAELQALDVSGMLSKPVELDELLELLQRWLGGGNHNAAERDTSRTDRG